jgi:hypothetical protein
MDTTNECEAWQQAFEQASKERGIAAAKDLRDRIAIGAMQSLIKAYIVFDGSGCKKQESKERNFSSLAADAMAMGWGSDSDLKSLSIAGRLAWDAYAIADAMLIERDKDRDEESISIKQETGGDGDAKATKETAGS